MQKSQDKGVWGDLRPSDHNPMVETVLAKGYARHLIAATETNQTAPESSSPPRLACYADAAEATDLTGILPTWPNTDPT